MKKRRYKSNLLMLGLLFVIGTTSVSFVGAETVTIQVFDHATASMYDYANTTITIPCFQEMLSARMVFEGYCDPDDPYLRNLRFFVDGNETTAMGRGGSIGTEQLGAKFQFGCITIPPPCGLIFPGGHDTWEFDMSQCAFANVWPETGWHYKRFIPQSPEETVGFFSPGEHLIEACITSEPAHSGPTYETWISITLIFELTPCVEGSLFSDALWILPVAILASSLMVLHQRRRH